MRHAHDTPRHVFPASQTQESFYYLHKASPDSLSYHVPVSLHLRGPLDSAALQRAWDDLLVRHPILRTSFLWKEGSLHQRVHASGQPLRLEKRETAAAKLEHWMEPLLREPFQLERTPPLRTRLVRFSEREHLLGIVLHHILCDEISLSLLLQELAEAYEAIHRKGRWTPTEKSVPYSAYALEETKRGRDVSKDKSFWRSYLEAVPEQIGFPWDYQEKKRNRARNLLFEGDMDLRKHLASLAKETNASLFMVLFAGFIAFLHKHTEEKDLAVAFPLSLRTSLEQERTLGPFLNTLLLRLNLGDNPSFRCLIERVRTHLLDILSHSQLSHQEIVSLLGPSREERINPLFNVLFAHHTGLLALSIFGNCDLDLPPVFPLESKFDLLLHTTDTGEKIRGRWEAREGLLSETTLKRMGGRFLELLSNGAMNPMSPLSEIEILPEKESRVILALGRSRQTNDTNPSPQENVSSFLIQQAERTPRGIALQEGDLSWSYAELLDQASSVTERLRGAGVREKDRVGVWADRSAASWIFALGILQTGAVCTPLDKSLPPSRLDQMIGTADPVAVTDPVTGNVDVLSKEALREQRNSPLMDPAYLLFTSGSTGVPKPVTLSHTVLFNLVQWQTQDSGCGQGAKTLQYASMGFDVSFQEAFSTWARGGTLVLCPKALKADFAALLRFLGERKIDRLFLPPVALHGLVNAYRASKDIDLSLKEMICAGEKLRITEDVVSFFEGLEGAVLVNQYGPTETHVVTSKTLEGPPSTWPTVPDLGEPLPHIQLAVKSGQGSLVPMGVKGELHVGGGPLHPLFPSSDGFYPTGDLCRWNHQGRLEYLGRKDHQIKVRGHRVELGEVESAILLHPKVKESVVLARKGSDPSSSDVCLDAFVRTEDPGAVEGTDLSGFLEDLLPSWMRPSSWFFLDNFPLNVNGKVDRLALEIHATEERTRPRTPRSGSPREIPTLSETEPLVLRTWRELLRIPDLGPNEDFFARGGNSLLAVQLLVRLSMELGLDVPLDVFLASPTVKGMAESISQGRVSFLTDCLVPLQTRGPAPPFFCVHGGGGHILDLKVLSPHLGTERPFYGFRMAAWGRPEQADQSIEEMASRYVSSLTEEYPEGPLLLGGYCVGATVAFEMVRRLEEQGRPVDLLLLIDGRAPGLPPPSLPRKLMDHLKRLRQHSWTVWPRYLALVGRRFFRKNLADVLRQRPIKELEMTQKGDAFMELSMKSWRAYLPAPLRCEAVLLRTADPELGEDLGWTPLLPEGLRVVQLETTHERLLQPPQVKELGRVLREILPLGPKLAEGEVHLWRIPLEGSPAQLEHARNLLNEEEKRRADRFHFQRDRDRFIMSHGALRRILASYLRRSPEKLQFLENASGKPSLADPKASWLQFNLSHSHDLCLLAVAQGMELGVDLERIREEMDIDAIAHRFFAEEEVAFLNQAAASERNAAFFALWTGKEALLKACGAGLAQGLKHCALDVANLDQNQFCSIKGSDCCLQPLKLEKEFAAALATTSPPNSIVMFDFTPFAK